MKFLPVELEYDPERKTGKLTVYEAVNENVDEDGKPLGGPEEWAAVGDTSLIAPLSDGAIEQIDAILQRETVRIVRSVHGE